MPSLPISTAFTDSAVTEAGFKTAITNQREFLAGLLDTSGNQIDALRKLGVLGSDTSAKSGAYTVVAADRGVTFLCTGTFTLSLTAAATLGDGFTFAVINIGTGTITIDPNSTELIDGASTDSIAAGSWAIVTCTGSAFRTMGAVPATGALIGYQVFTANGTYSKGTNNPSFVVVEVQAGGGSGGGQSGAPANGNPGGTSSFGAHCSATGGAGGTIGGGLGGLGSGGDINARGGGGGFGSTTEPYGGAGGSSNLTGGGVGGTGSAGSAGTHGAGGGGCGYGSSPFGRGGGGAGGYTKKKIAAASLSASETVTVGNGGAAVGSISASGSGGSGLVIVWEYK